MSSLRWEGSKGKSRVKNKGQAVLQILAERDWVFERRLTRKRMLFFFLLFVPPSFSGLTFLRCLIFKTLTRKRIHLKCLPLIIKSCLVVGDRWLTSPVDFLVTVGQGLPLHFPSCWANGESFPLGSTHPGAIFQGKIADGNSHWRENISLRETR